MASNSWDDGKGHRMTITITESNVNSANNTSTLNASLKIEVLSSGGDFIQYTANPSYLDIHTAAGTSTRVWVAPTGANVTSTQYGLNGYHPSDLVYGTTSLTFSGSVADAAHLSDGSGTAYARGLFRTDSTTSFTPYYTEQSVALTLTNFSRVPQAPAAPKATRSSNGTTIDLLSSTGVAATGTPSPPAITDYRYRWSTDNSVWTTATTTMGSDGVGTNQQSNFGPTSPISVSKTQTYYFQTRAINSEGEGAWSNSLSLIGVPTAPPTVTATRSGTSITVTCTASSGTSITDYKVQYAASTNNGATYGSWTSVAGGLGDSMGASTRSYTYSSLAPATTYKFRVLAVNSIPDTINSTTTVGQSDYTESSSVYLLAVGQRYDAATTQYKQMTVGQRYDALNGWTVLTTARRYDPTYTDPITGSNWRPFS